ncbi:MAG: exodeoxyribonuclease VII large subunit, partial [Enterobacterales bacterium]|nr:exodeoxyribonuclease VII large subunit [Enterobacterales bacterium]
TAVQGADAPMQIVRAIELANQRKECDVLIVGRGGGSLEDLWSFNDERVAQAIFASLIPIVSAVGHETDVTIADFVGDLRAPTPSAAAELVSRNQTELMRQMLSQQQRMEMAMDYYLARHQQRFTRLNHRLQQQHPQLRLARQHTLLIKLRRRLDEAVQTRLRLAERQQERTSQRLNQQQPSTRIQRHQQRIEQLHNRLELLVQRQLSGNRERFGALCSQLEGVSPLATLARGFSVTQPPSGGVLKSIKQVAHGDLLKTRVQDGWVESTVTSTAALPKKRSAKYNS